MILLFGFCQLIFKSTISNTTKVNPQLADENTKVKNINC